MPESPGREQYIISETQRLREQAGLSSRRGVEGYEPTQHPDLINAELAAEGEASGEKLRAARIKEQRERLFERPPSPGSNLHELEKKLGRSQ